MNKIYKTVLNKNTGEIVAVSEKETSNSRSQCGTNPKNSEIEIHGLDLQSDDLPKLSTKKRALVLVVGLSLASFYSSNAFAATTYDGTATLTDSTLVGGNFSQIINNPAGKGVYDATESDADVTVNYATGDTPDFVLAGYSSVNADNTAEAKKSLNNTVTLQQGKINGNVYAGLVEGTVIAGDRESTSNLDEFDPLLSSQISNKQLDANNNIINVLGQNEIDVIGNFYAGYTGINIQYGEITANPSPSSEVDAYALSMVDVTNNALNANSNQINISGQKKAFNNLAAGYTGINIQYGNFIASGTSNNRTNSAVTASANASNSALNANLNLIKISGQNNTFNNLTAGYAGIHIQYGDLTSSGITTDSVYTVAGGQASSSNGLLDSPLNANLNQINTSGQNNSFNNLSVGYVGFNLQHGDLSVYVSSKQAEFAGAGIVDYASNNTLNANSNLINIAGENNSFNNLSTGYAGINIQYGDTTVNSMYKKNPAIIVFAKASKNALNVNSNQINISGENNTFNNLSAGYAGVNIQFGDVISANTDATTTANANANANAYANASGNTLNTNSNQINIIGENNTFNNLSAGYAGINLQYGNITGGTKIINSVTTYDGSTLDVDLSSTTLSASENIISLTGSSTVNGSVNTGYIDFNIDHGEVKKADGSDGTITVTTTGTKATATNNTISIDGEHKFTNPDATIYGGYLAYNTAKGYKPESYDVFTGNTLNYANKTPISIGSVANFQTYKFVLTPEQANSSTPLISAKSISLGANETNISDGSTTASDVYVTGIHSGKLVPTNSKFILMQGDDFTGAGTGHISSGVAQQGISLLYDVETKVDTDNKQVIAIIKAGHGVNSQVKSLLEGNLSGLMLLDRGTDNLSDSILAAINDQNNKRGLVPFIIVSGNHTNYDSGSSIKSNGAFLTAGLSVQGDQSTVGLFSENGWDSYKTHNDFSDAAEVNGKGHNRFHGVGIYGHYDFKNNWYADGTIRGGRLLTTFSTDDLRNAVTQEKASYDISSSYYGVNLKGGYIFDWNAKNKVDLSAKYAWVGTSAQDLVVAGDNIHFDKMNSHRVTLNAENSYQTTPEMSVLTGLGVEYEFDAKATGTTYETFNIPSPSLKGATGLVSLGLHYQPTSNKRLSLDVKGNGYFGKRDGGSGLVRVNYQF
ncbi:autotransporter domain-containing protein [Acinetobacter sp. MD2(2019)]|uniref:autotransporter domain-containing protein n=1 Tax=Acinetobacter sp. MD2(2019) TaxID=2605273 RepID=UPI002D1EEC64|nr:hypothetical protein [Acinetobacter sp. MD2(2019)]MEB3753640.1 autotransporter domain-containing protein [Acinetobacter sp. MD2(2019)]